jgi:very-short-patch-repair endonuclease
MPLPTVVRELLSEQDGLITHAQALAHGISEWTVQRRVRSGDWHRLHPRVYLVGGHPHTEPSRVRAAGLWADGRGVISGPAAAFWLGMLPSAPGRIEVTVPRGCGLRGHGGVRVRRRDLEPLDRRRSRGVWHTDRALTVLETAIAVPDGSAFLDRALQKHVSFEKVYRAYCRNMGAHGFSRAAALLTAAADRADSAAERIVINLLRAAGITGWQPGFPFHQWKIDIAFPGARVAIEIDGWAWHSDVERFRTDRHKGNALVRAGWAVLRFTWHDLTNRPDYVLAQIKAALLTAAASA